MSTTTPVGRAAGGSKSHEQFYRCCRRAAINSAQPVQSQVYGDTCACKLDHESETRSIRTEE